MHDGCMRPTWSFGQTVSTEFSSPDAELRDELSYIILASGIIGKQKLTQDQLEALLTTALDDKHLTKHSK